MRRPQFSIKSLLWLMAALSTISLLLALATRSRRPFDPDTWKRCAGFAQPTLRSEMVSDLLDRCEFRGWWRPDVVRLLGEPDAQSADAGVPGDVAYYLGPESDGPFALDDRYLWFKFQDDKVVDFGLSVN